MKWSLPRTKPVEKHSLVVEHPVLETPNDNDSSRARFHELVRNVSFRHVSLAVTMRCNLTCDFCYSRNNYWKTDLTLSEARRSSLLATENISLGGGEPTLWPHLFSFVKWASDRGLNIGITTNGWFVNHPRQVRKFEEINDLVSWNLSMHGMTQLSRTMKLLKKWKHVRAINFLVKKSELAQLRECLRELRTFDIPIILLRYLPVNGNWKEMPDLEDLDGLLEEGIYLGSISWESHLHPHAIDFVSRNYQGWAWCSFCRVRVQHPEELFLIHPEKFQHSYPFPREQYQALTIMTTKPQSRQLATFSTREATSSKSPQWYLLRKIQSSRMTILRQKTCLPRIGNKTKGLLQLIQNASSTSLTFVPEHSSYYCLIIAGKDDKIHIIDITSDPSEVSSDPSEASSSFIDVEMEPEEYFLELIKALKLVMTGADRQKLEADPRVKKAKEDLLKAGELLRIAETSFQEQEKSSVNWDDIRFSDLQRVLGDKFREWPFSPEQLADPDYELSFPDCDYLLITFDWNSSDVILVSRCPDFTDEDEQDFELGNVARDLLLAHDKMKGKEDQWTCLLVKELWDIISDKIVKYYMA